MNVALKKYQQAKRASSFTSEEKEKLVIEYAPLVKAIASKISSRLPKSIQIDDLISAGIMGLMDAIDKWDPSRQTKLRTYAEFRIKGAILDELRAQDWVPRTIRDKAKLVDKANRELEQKLGRLPTEEEIADHLQISLEEYYEMLYEIRPVNVLSLDEGIFNEDEKRSLIHVLQAEKHSSPAFQFNFKKVQKIIKKALDELPEKIRFVLALYYYEDLNFREISEIMQVTESRVSQLHYHGIFRLRTRVHELLENSEIDMG
jgi:RNA polymerase sigma factor for flagellar operon FliA